MIDNSKMVRPDFMPDAGEMSAVCVTLHKAAEIIDAADRIPDETAKEPLLTSAKILLQNVIDAIDGRRTDGLVMPEDDGDDE